MNSKIEKSSREVQIVATVLLLFVRHLRNQIAGFSELKHGRLQLSGDVRRHNQLRLHNLLTFLHAGASVTRE